MLLITACVLTAATFMTPQIWHHPGLKEVLRDFGVNLEGPSELLPFEPTLVLACYRVQGRILSWGSAPLWAGDVLIQPEIADEHSFFLWVGEMELPWVQDEAPDEVVSPANLPEFLERMQYIWLLRHGDAGIVS